MKGIAHRLLFVLSLAASMVGSEPVRAGSPADNRRELGVGESAAPGGYVPFGKYHPYFPRLADVAVAMTITPETAASLARFDVILASTCNRSQNAGYVHAIDPETIVLFYSNAIDIYDDAATCGADNPRGPLQQIILANDYFLRRTDGSRFANWYRGDSLWSYIADISPDNRAYSKPLMQWFAEDIMTPFLVSQPEFDGVFWDVQLYDMAVDPATEWWRRWAPISIDAGANDIDLDRDGVAEPVSEVNASYHAGLALLHQAMRDRFPDKVFITNGNNIVHPSTDGSLQEQFIGGWTWAPYMIEYFSNFDATYGADEPNVVILHDPNLSAADTEAGLRQSRYLIASTLMHDGYVAISDQNYNKINTWYDEYAVDGQGHSTQDPSGKGYLGIPLGSAYAADDPDVLLADVLKAIAASGTNLSAAEDHLWRRDFEYGTVLINPSSSQKAATGLGQGTYKRILGALDTAVNNGAVVDGPVSIPGHDGLVLILANPDHPIPTPTPPPPAMSYRLTAPAVIDGHLSEWGGVAATQAEFAYSQAPSQPADADLAYRTAWDEGFLYFAFEVSDEALVSGDSTKIWEDDGLELYLDGDRDPDPAYNPGDHQYTFNLLGEIADLGVVSTTTGVAHVLRIVEGGYVLEVAAPWPAVGLAGPPEGGAIGFDVALNDDDDGGMLENHLVLFPFASHPSADTTAFGELVVDGEAVERTPFFADVGADHPYRGEIEGLYQAGYTAGCGTEPLAFCPERAMNRAESAVFMERGLHGADVVPDDPASAVFADVDLGAWYADWVTALWEDGYTAGCGTDPLVYCPEKGQTRAEGAVFYLRMLNGISYEPPAAQGVFADVPVEAWYARWVEAAYEAKLIEPCQTAPDLRYCPGDPLTRQVAAEFYLNAVEVMRGAEAINEYITLPRREAFDIKYWTLEEAKLRRMPPEKGWPATW